MLGLGLLPTGQGNGSIREMSIESKIEEIGNMGAAEAEKWLEQKKKEIRESRRQTYEESILIKNLEIQH